MDVQACRKTNAEEMERNGYLSKECPELAALRRASGNSRKSETAEQQQEQAKRKNEKGR
jgi:hypothetical protein